MLLRYRGVRPGVVHGEATWQPGEEREVADDARLRSPLWERVQKAPARRTNDDEPSAAAQTGARAKQRPTRAGEN